MKNSIGLLLLILFCAIHLESKAQESKMQENRSINKLEIGKKKKETFTSKNRDSSLVLLIDTLIMKDRSTLEFFAVKNLTLKIKHAIIPKEAYIVGTDSKNNGTNMDITVKLDQLGSLYVLAGGRDAINGTRTFPNGNGGNVKFYYNEDGIKPQEDHKNRSAYLRVDTKAGGYRVNPQTDLMNIYSQINMGIRMGNGRLSPLPQGQVYSGSPGKDGTLKVNILIPNEN